jgi:uncharacterized membrane protein (DUF485 family)
MSTPATSNVYSPVQATFEDIIANDYVFAVLVILAFAYGQQAKPKLPKWLVTLFSYDIVRVMFLSLLLIVRFESRPTVAIIIAVAFVYILQYVYIEQTNEHFDNLINKRKHI